MTDLKFAIRQLVKNPGFTAVAVLTLALGIGVNTAMFGGFQSLLLRTLAYPEADRLVRLFRTSSHSQKWPHSAANFLDHQSQNPVFERMAAVNRRSFNLVEPGQQAERLQGLEVTSELIPLLGIAPMIGRGFIPDEAQPGRNDVAILGHSFWLRRFAGDTNIVGKSLRMDGQTVTVLGVMPPGFSDVMLWGTVDVLRPLAFSDEQRQNRGANYLMSVGRLKPGVSVAQADAAMAGIADRLAKEFPEVNADSGLRVVSLAGSGMDPKGRIMIWMIMGLAGFVLLIACANLANLQFARTALRTREFAIRGALGAPRSRLMRQLLTESLLVALIGGALGLVLAVWVNGLLNTRLLREGEPALNLGLNFGVLGFALVVSTVTGLAFGLVPAWMAARTDANSALKQGSRGTTADRSQNRLRHGLIVTQVALALMLLAGAGTFANGLRNFGVRDPGWRVDGLTVGYLNLPDATYADATARLGFATRLREHLAAIPGVAAAAVAGSLPIAGFRTSAEFSIEDQPDPSVGRRRSRSINVVTPGYFATLGMRLLEGRDFLAGDTPGQPGVVVVNETMARSFWAGESALGKRIGTPGAWLEVVGVVDDVRFPSDPGEPPTRFQSYIPLAQEPPANLAIAVRGNVSVATLRQTVAGLDQDLPLNQPGLARAAVREVLDQAAVAGWLLGGFAGLGVLLATLGLYGVIAGFVTQRTNEIGIRMALGAQLGDVLRLVLGKGVRLTLLGSGIGLVGAFGLTRVLGALAPGLESNSPLILALVVGLLMGVALIACWLPARRASRVDPMVALRSE
ncbi:MAG: ABC transporter permease [Limisphaerales bacterium]